MAACNCQCLFRVEAGPGVGLGHLSRCLALALWLKNAGAECAFVMTGPDQNVTERVAQSGFKLLHRQPQEAVGSAGDAKKLALTAHRYEARWVVVDGYGFGKDYFETLRANSQSLILAVDDFQGQVEADLILNQNLAVDQGLYSGTKSGLLLGPKYCLLPPGLQNQEPREYQAGAGKLLVTSGGINQKWLIADVLSVLSDLHGLEVDVVIGPFNKDQYFTSERSSRFEYHISPPSLIPLIKAADFAVMGLGITTWEMAALGLPMVTMPQHPAQLPTAKWLEENKFASMGMDLGNFLKERFLKVVQGLLSDPKELERQGRALQKLVDGRGGG